MKMKTIMFMLVLFVGAGVYAWNPCNYGTQSACEAASGDMYGICSLTEIYDYAGCDWIRGRDCLTNAEAERQTATNEVKGNCSRDDDTCRNTDPTSRVSCDALTQQECWSFADSGIWTAIDAGGGQTTGSNRDNAICKRWCGTGTCPMGNCTTYCNGVSCTRE